MNQQVFTFAQTIDPTVPNTGSIWSCNNITYQILALATRKDVTSPTDTKDVVYFFDDQYLKNGGLFTRDLGQFKQLFQRQQSDESYKKATIQPAHTNVTVKVDFKKATPQQDALLPYLGDIYTNYQNNTVQLISTATQKDDSNPDDGTDIIYIYTDPTLKTTGLITQNLDQFLATSQKVPQNDATPLCHCQRQQAAKTL